MVYDEINFVHQISRHIRNYIDVGLRKCRGASHAHVVLAGPGAVTMIANKRAGTDPSNTTRFVNKSFALDTSCLFLCLCFVKECRSSHFAHNVLTLFCKESIFPYIVNM